METVGKDAIFSQTASSFMPSSPTNLSSLSSETPEQLLNLFTLEGMLDIGDEVTVPSSPLSFHTDTDHSYFSSATPAPLRFDCISETSLPEFHDLFDFHPFDLIRGESNIDVQEQVIESNESSNRNSPSSSSNKLSRGEVWMNQGSDSRGSGTESNENTMESNSSSSDSEHEHDEESEVEKMDKNRNPKTRFTGNHHKGPFPHTFISTPGDRRIRFCFGLQTIITKIKALMSRTGASADFRADFESHTFTLDNAEKLLKFSDRSQKGNKNDASNVSSSGLGGLGPDEDHRYAATILTQTESSSSVRDHQYNDVSTTGDVKKRKKPQKCFIRTRYARERWLRKAATTIYSKMQRLMNRTGARMTLTLEYQGLLVTPKNYKELEHLLGQYRPTMKKFNTKIVIEKRNSVSNSKSISLDSQGKVNSNTVMKVSFPRSQRGLRQSPSLNVEIFGAPAQSRGFQGSMESDHDYGSTSPTIGTSDYPVSVSPAPTSELPILLPEPHVESLESFSGEGSACMDEGYGKRQRMDVGTNTEVICQICGTPDQDKSWIRCANPLCHYLVHPPCIGFFLINAQQLSFLPPYFCPSHRQLHN